METKGRIRKKKKIKPDTHPFQTRRKTGTTAPTQAGSLDLPDDPVVALEEDLLGLVPVAHLLGVLEVGGVAAVEVLEDAVLITQAAVGADRGSSVGVLDGSEGAAL